MGAFQSSINSKEELKAKRSRIQKLIKLIDKEYKNKFIHVSLVPLNINSIYNSNKNNLSWFGGTVDDIYYNPRGLWFSCGADWIKWVKKWNSRYSSQWLTAKYIYEIKINKNNILQIHNKNELIKFHKKYAKYSSNNGSYNIIWSNVKKDYDGLIICPYLGPEIWKKIRGQNVDSFYIYKNEYTYIKDALGKDIMKSRNLFGMVSPLGNKYRCHLAKRGDSKY
jgi:hypothetical protein